MAVIYAGTRGYLDNVAVSDVGRYEKDLLSSLRTRHADLLNAIRDKKALSPELEEQLKTVVADFTSNFA